MRGMREEVYSRAIPIANGGETQVRGMHEKGGIEMSSTRKLNQYMDVAENYRRSAKQRLSTIRRMAATMGVRERNHAKELAAVNAEFKALAFQLVVEQAKYGDLREEMREDKKAIAEWRGYQAKSMQSEINRGDKWCCSALVLFAIVIGQAAFMVWG